MTDHTDTDLHLYRDGTPVPGDLRENIVRALQDAVAANKTHVEATLEIGNETLGRKAVSACFSARRLNNPEWMAQVAQHTIVRLTGAWIETIASAT